jgi:peptide/nickel transport system permease protein
MFAYVIRRLFIMIPTLLAISFLIFVIIQAPPGDYLSTVIAECQSRGESGCQDKMKFLQDQFHLGDPFIKQYGYWVWGLLQGDLGYSFEYQLPVSQVVGDRLWLTMIVAFATVLFTWIVAFPIGSTRRPINTACRTMP